MKFTEQVYSKKSKIYWHGSRYPEFNRDLSRYGYFFLTPDFEYAARYCVDRVAWEYKYMYACSFSKPLNIFNPRDSLDEHIFRKRFNVKDELYEQLKEEHWLDLFGEVERSKILETLKTLGYDGFFNFEYDKQGASIGIFDPANVKILRVYEGKEIEEFVNTHKDLVKRKNRQREKVERGLFKIFPSLLTREELSSILNNSKDFESTYDDLLTLRRARKIENAKRLLRRIKEGAAKKYLEDRVEYPRDVLEQVYDLLTEKDFYRNAPWNVYD